MSRPAEAAEAGSSSSKEWFFFPVVVILCSGGRQFQLDSCHHFNRLHLHPDALVLALDHSNWWHLQTDALLCCTRVLSTQRPGSIQVTGLLSNCNLALRHLHACRGVSWQAWALLPWTPMCFNILKRFNSNAECMQRFCQLRSLWSQRLFQLWSSWSQGSTRPSVAEPHGYTSETSGVTWLDREVFCHFLGLKQGSILSLHCQKAFVTCMFFPTHSKLNEIETTKDTTEQLLLFLQL